MVPENKQNRRYNHINFIVLQNNRHPSQHTVGNVHKASGNCHMFLDCHHAAEILWSITKEAFADSSQKLYEHCQQCVVKDGDYFEDQ
jgi:hypothetical protein